MARNCFLPRQWRLPRIIWVLMLLEFPFTVANLALFGVASPNLYRTILWSEGGRMGFNSDPTTVLYAYANYRPVETPLIWSNFNTEYHLVIGVVGTFFWLIKATMWLLHIFFPIISLLLHLGLMAIWAYGIYIQTSPDTIDPERINNGAPWYITQNCNIVDDKLIKSYCMQAKSSFAVSIIMLVIYCAFILMSLYSLWPTKEARAAHATKVAEKKAQKEKWESSPYDNEMTAEEQWQHMWELQQLPRTPGTTGGMRSPATPRTFAFNQLEGGYYGADQKTVPQVQQTYVSPVQERPQQPVQQTFPSPVKQTFFPSPVQQNFPSPQQQQHASFQTLPQQQHMSFQAPPQRQQSPPQPVYSSPVQQVYQSPPLQQQDYESESKGKGTAY